MPIPVRLKDVLDAIEPLSDQWTAYLHRRHGEIVGFTEEEALMAEEDDDEDAPDWIRDQLPRIREAATSDDYIRLPGVFEFNEHAVVRDFCFGQDDGVRQALLDAFRGRGAFRRFKDTVQQLDLDGRWYAHRDQALQTLAIEFLQAEGIPFVAE